MSVRASTAAIATEPTALLNPPIRQGAPSREGAPFPYLARSHTTTGIYHADAALRHHSVHGP